MKFDPELVSAIAEEIRRYDPALSEAPIRMGPTPLGIAETILSKVADRIPDVCKKVDEEWFGDEYLARQAPGISLQACWELLGMKEEPDAADR